MTAALDDAYRGQRLRLANIVSATASRYLSQMHDDQSAAIAAVVPVVEAGQSQTVSLVDAYMAAKTLQVTGQGTVLGLDPTRYTITALRNGVAATDVYTRAFNTLHAVVEPQQALTEAHAALDKLVRTDLQLAQTHASRDWIDAQNALATDETRIVGWRRVTDGDPCPLCAAAATRTYRTGQLMPIHEHCSCTVEPLWGDHGVASIGTTVRVERDPEIGPRLMADTWSDVGPRLL